MANKTKLKKAYFGKVKIIYFKMINQRGEFLFWNSISKQPWKSQKVIDLDATKQMFV